MSVQEPDLLVTTAACERCGHAEHDHWIPVAAWGREALALGGVCADCEACVSEGHIRYALARGDRVVPAHFTSLVAATRVRDRLADGWRVVALVTEVAA